MGKLVREGPVGKEGARLARAEDEDQDRRGWAAGWGLRVQRTGGAARPLRIPGAKGAGPAVLLAALPENRAGLSPRGQSCPEGEGTYLGTRLS